MGQIYSFEGIVPVVDPSAHVHPTAVLIGDVIIGPGCYVGPNAVLRGDIGRIEMRQGSNIQDNCVAHTFPDMVMLLEEDGHVGHGAVLHGCTVGRNAMVGMNAVVMDRVIIGENTIVGAMSFVKAGMALPSDSLVIGSPARIVRRLTEDEIRWKSEGTRVYQQLAVKANTQMARVAALSRVQERQPRPAAEGAALRPLIDQR